MRDIYVLLNGVKVSWKHLKPKEKEAGSLKKYKDSHHVETKSRQRPALSPKARENQLIALAIDVAEDQLRNGTASSQVITHYLKLGSTKERLEQEILEKQKQLIEAKTESLQSAKRVEELYVNALSAMKNYSGQVNETNDDEY